MSDHCLPKRPAKVAADREGTRDRVFLGLLVMTLIRAGEAWGADPSTVPAGKLELSQTFPRASISAAPFASTRGIGREFLPADSQRFDPLARSSFSAVDGGLSVAAPAELRSFSSSDFRPRGRSIDAGPRMDGEGGDRLAFDRPIWQRLSEYRNHDRVRVLTLWESGASAVSLQTNTKGDPSLQWTSRLMNRGGATRGLLDQWSPMPLLRGLTRFGSSSPARSAGPAVAAR